MRFDFAADTFRYGADVRYQTRLDDPGPAVWSALSPQAGVDYANLPAGNYTFRVRSRDRDGREGGETDYPFQVRPYWTRTPWALGGYGVLGALAVAGTVQWRSRRLRRANAALETRVARQTGDLVRARDAAETANRAKSAFLANMSHELRTPLNAILGYTQIMLKDPSLPDKNRERLGVVAHSGEHLLGLINEVLDLSKIEAGKFRPDPADFALARLLEAAADTFRHRTTEKNVAFVFHGDPGLPTGVHEDEGKLRQILFNLLGNAVKFTGHGQVTLRVERLAPDWVHFEVADTGTGIAPDQLESIFLAFHRAPGTGAPGVPGTGLGLAISRRLVEMLGGELRVESTPGVGSRFWFDLPLPEVAVLPTAMADFGPGAGGVVTGYRGPRRRLLIVDDDAANRRVLREFLQPLDFILEELAGGEEGVDRCIRQPRPELVLLDLRLGGIDGFETARRLRERPENAGLKIVAVFASVFESDRRQALDAGCDDFLPKPFAEDALLAVLGRALDIRWITLPAADAPMAPAHPAAVEALTPPAAELDALLELSRRGDVLKIRHRLASLREADPRHARFVEPLERLAASYQMNRLRAALLELQCHEH